MKKNLKNFFMLFLPLALVLGVITVLLYQVRVGAEELLLKKTAQSLLKDQQKTISTMFAQVASDLRVLANHHEFDAFGRGDVRARASLTKEFLSFSHYKKSYDQIRFLDNSGLEIIRIQRENGKPAPLAEDELLLEETGSYFTEAGKLTRDEVYVSPFALSTDNDRIEQPLKPILRFSTPVFDREGWKLGVAALNYLGAHFLDQLKKNADESPGRFMLLNADGYWLASDRAADEWGFMYPNQLKKTLKKRQPEVWRKIIGEETGQFYHDNALYTFTTVHPFDLAGNKSSATLFPTLNGDAQQDGDQRFWKLVSHIEPNILAQRFERIHGKYLAASGISLFFLATGCWFLALARARRRESQEDLRQYLRIVSTAADHMYLLGRDYKFLAVNDAFLNAHAKQREQVLGRSAAEVFGDDIFHRFLKEKIDRALAGETTRLRGWFKFTVPGRLFMDMAVLPVRGPDDKIPEVAMNWRDITALRQAEDNARMLAEFPEQHPNPVLRVNKEGAIIYANPAAADLLEKWMCRVGEQLPDSFLEKFASALESDTVCRDIEMNISGAIYSFMTVPVPTADSLYLYGQDITESREYEKQLLLLASVFANTIEGIVITDKDGTIEKVNPGFTAITGYTPEEAIGNNPRILKSDRHDNQFYQTMWEKLSREGFWSGEIWNRRKNGEPYPERLSITVIRDSRGEVSHYVAVFYDISEIKRGEEELQHQYYHDALTGLPNRQLFIDRLEMSLAHAKRSKEMLAVLFMDLDNFKHINDSLGHHVGDLFLRKVADILQLNCRMEDTVARHGGDEFIMLLPDIKNENDAFEVARRIMTSLSQPIMLEEHELFAGVSIGITLYPSDGVDAATLIKNADLAMYRAKETGKNKYQLFAEAMNEKVDKRLRMENSLRGALERQEFQVYYQPKVSLADGTMTGAEALVRWVQADGTVVSPLDFIPLAEETGLIVPIGEWVLRAACEQTKKWHDMGFPISVSVNLSPRQFHQKELAQMIIEVLRETGLPSWALEFEITESIVMDSIDEAVESLNFLRTLGIRFSIDDFGTGYSSMQYLKRLPINALKIDRSFVRDLPDNEDDIAITSATISMAHSLGLKVVAEGVDNPRQLIFLRERGGEQFQGYLFSKPVEAQIMEQYLKDGKQQLV